MNFEEFYRDYGIRKLDLKEYITAFSCGDDDLDDFILNDAPYTERLYWLSLISLNGILIKK